MEKDVLVIGRPIAEFFSKEVIDFKLNIPWLSSEKYHDVNSITRCWHLQVRLVFVVASADCAEVVLIISSTLAERNDVIDLQSTFLPFFATRVLPSPGPADLACIPIAFEYVSTKFVGDTSCNDGFASCRFQDILTRFQVVTVVMCKNLHPFLITELAYSSSSVNEKG